MPWLAKLAWIFPNIDALSPSDRCGAVSHCAHALRVLHLSGHFDGFVGRMMPAPEILSDQAVRDHR